MVAWKVITVQGLQQIGTPFRRPGEIRTATLTWNSASRSEAIPEDTLPAGKDPKWEIPETRDPPDLPTDAVAKSKPDKSFREKEHMSPGLLHGVGAFKLLHQKVKFNFSASTGAGPVASLPVEGSESDDEQFLNLGVQGTGSLRFATLGIYVSQRDWAPKSQSLVTLLEQT